MRVSALALFAALPVIAEGAFCHGSPSKTATRNTFPINETAPVFIRSVPNGKLFQAGPPGSRFNVMHLYGSPYDWGYAHASLFPQGFIANLTGAVWSYLEEQVTSQLTTLPTWLADIIADAGLTVALDVIANLTAPYTGPYWFEELQGMGAAAGVDWRQIYRIHLIGELTQGDCSLVGAWGSSILGNAVIGARALDWDTDIPCVQYPTVTVYHPAGANATGQPFANVGFLSWIGALSGFSSRRLGIHEIGIDFPDASFGNESFSGIPFVFLLRDILMFDNNLNDATTRIKDAHRTCDLVLGVTSGPDNTARGIQYSASVANVMDDATMGPKNDTWHPEIKDTVYLGMDWLCPGYNLVLSEQLQAFHGSLTPQNLISDVLALTTTGDVHAVVYDTDPASPSMYVSFYATQSSSNATTLPNAYQRPYTKLDMNALFAEQPPTTFTFGDAEGEAEAY